MRNRSKKEKVLIITFAVCFCFILMLKPVFAAAIVGVSPGNIYFKDVLRDGYAERYITITIDSETPVIIKLEARGEIGNWLEFPENLSISKNNPGRPLIAVKPPSDVPNGNYTGFLRIAIGSPDGSYSETSETEEERATSTVRAVLDIAVRVEITDLEILKCRAKNFRVKSIEKGDDIPFQIEILNEGNIRLKPEVLFDIWDQEQISIVKTISLKGKEILPTREENLLFKIQSHDLELDQYWVDVDVQQCLASETLTFDVLEQGALKAEGILLSIFSRVWSEVDETIPITANFKNVGEKDVDARFKGKITHEGKIIQVLESEKTTSPIGEITNFTFFFTPRKAGKYIASGRVFYDKKRTFESSTIINISQKKFGIKEFALTVTYILIIIFIAFLIYNIRKEKRRYLKKIKNA